MARLVTIGLNRPLFTADQVAPPLVVFQMPPPPVATYTVLGVAGSMTNAWIAPPSGPFVVHVLTPASARLRSAAQSESARRIAVTARRPAVRSRRVRRSRSVVIGISPRPWHLACLVVTDGNRRISW